ncbi:sorting nexin-13-like isoform X2 [Portunus trituberculatus]|uniref:sorting nexin-13-like isoform X1 n=1 Tax=Portunus trituberculatus TaxID=210409 RepID=UPI001E1D0A10|nr:sorting nexin-13-like isoform X1 [Portunus trituberculatus]XP_045123517.1 sorting nexin-13-like isoform X2 [Portunus trituberculatus]
MAVVAWLVLSAVLLVGSLGLQTCLSVLLSVILFGCGWLVALRWCSLEESEQMWLNIHRAHLPLPRDHHDKVFGSIQLNSSVEKQDRRVTGSSLIDEQLQSVVTLVVRDFVLNWYTELSGHQAFLGQLHRSLQHSLVVLANRCKSMDWVGYLTTRLVDDIASHLRLFREARSAMARGKAGQELIDQFFEREAEKEKDICRDEVCLKPDAEKDYLSDLAEIVLYYILPPEDFSNAPLRAAVLEILVSSVILPVVTLISDPDYINTLIIWACTGIPVTSELFVTVIKGTSNVGELEAVRSLVVKETASLRSRDSGNRDEGSEVKQQLGSLEFIKRVIDNRINRIDKGSETDSMGLSVNLDYRKLARGKLFQLPLEAILKNSLTLDHFLKYMASINTQHYLNLYLNIECWRTTVNERLCALELERLQHLEESGVQGSGVTMMDICHDHFSANDLSSHKEEAEIIYEQYLSEKASPRVAMDDSIVKRLILRMRSEKVSETWFDEVQSALFLTLQEADLFLPAFRRSMWYIKLLAELDLLKDVSRSDEEDSQSLDDVSFNSLEQVEEGDGLCQPTVALSSGSSGGEAPRAGDSHSTSSSHSAHSDEKHLRSVSRSSSRAQSPQPTSLHPSPCHTRSPSLTKAATLTARIIDTEIVREGTKSHAIYIVSVMRRDLSGQEELWHVFRRYSEFYDFHLSLVAKFPELSSVAFPSKRMLNNLAAWFLEKRKSELDEWLQCVLAPSTLQAHSGLLDAVQKFLDQTSYLSSQPQNLAKKMEDNLMVPLKAGVHNVSRAVRSMPDTVFNTVDGMVDGLYRKFVKPTHPRLSVNTDYTHRGSFDLEGDENIPLRILLQLMDEVFDLRSKDQWFRRRIMLFLRQILKAMFGDIVNRRIVDYVAFITAPEQVADYVKTFKESLWPNGILVTPSAERDEAIKMRTRVAARTCMLASISDELKAILGSQTTARGVLGVYDTVQWPALNRRLVYVLLEGMVESLLTNQRQIPPLLRSLHAGSARITAKHVPHPRRTRSDR